MLLSLPRLSTTSKCRLRQTNLVERPSTEVGKVHSSSHSDISTLLQASGAFICRDEDCCACFLSKGRALSSSDSLLRGFGNMELCSSSIVERGVRFRSTWPEGTTFQISQGSEILNSSRTPTVQACVFSAGGFQCTPRRCQTSASYGNAFFCNAKHIRKGCQSPGQSFLPLWSLILTLI